MAGRPDHARRPDHEEPGHEELGGDPACWAHLLCPECGAVLDPGPVCPACRWSEGGRDEEQPEG